MLEPLWVCCRQPYLAIVRGWFHHLNLGTCNLQNTIHKAETSNFAPKLHFGLINSNQLKLFVRKFYIVCMFLHVLMGGCDCSFLLRLHLDVYCCLYFTFFESKVLYISDLFQGLKIIWFLWVDKFKFWVDLLCKYILFSDFLLVGFPGIFPWIKIFLGGDVAVWSFN